MQNHKENIILFPKWRSILEKESLLALKQKRYGEALGKLDELLRYQVQSHEIIIGKLICLMELGRYEEAQNLCEDLLKNRDENYYHYVHIYLTILFQTGQYQAVMEQVNLEHETPAMPNVIKEQFQELYAMSEKMKDQITVEKSAECMNELVDAVKKENHIKQWRTIENLRKLSSVPTKFAVAMLVKEKVHPVTKTAIFLWLKDQEISKLVNIHKLDFRFSARPADISDIKSHTSFKQIILIINELEQKNPSLYKMIEKLLYRFLYVRYPIMPEGKETWKVAQALRYVGEDYLDIHMKRELPNHDVQNYINEIKICETLYLSIIEE